MQPPGAGQALVAAKTLFFSLAAETLLPRLDFLSSLIFPFFILSLAIYPPSDSLRFRNLSLTLKLSFFADASSLKHHYLYQLLVPSSDLTLLSPPTKKF